MVYDTDGRSVGILTNSLHGSYGCAVFPARACGMEAGFEPQHRTQVNPYAGWPDLG